MEIIKINKSVIDDLKFGLGQELVFKPVLEEFLGFKLEQTPQNDTFDYINEEFKILIEMKSRKNKKAQYPTTMIGENKWKASTEKCNDGWDIYYVFNFTDKLCIYKFKKDNRDNIKKSTGGRRDRGRPEFKYYRYIPIELLFDIDYELV